ncbi:hypothetical protein BVRB_1g007800 [Beta vulgaris subsp. vulgaris]|uniref:zinc finger BED domain-containing protein RICESLEEPER 1 n=1 Tax=Beta vulgaris subsp. vulgaris TaxID=3555 RepID=UPI00053F4C9E|nr:zinc finger BED domain-containing protein RICESLEEPER 1 [Beta vulgaris subsp. vulgaris]KMT19725.1 hypothetical protein BVRB_1g007800 [Beta vulgaris subsp. vulgaris]
MDDQVSGNLKFHNACVRVVGEEGVVDQPNKRRKLDFVAGNRRSLVWEHFDIMTDKGRLHAQCKYCESTNYRAEGHYGTSNCRKHLKTCKAYKNVLNKKLLAKNTDRVSEFDEQVYCKLFAEAIVSHDYPLSIVENEEFRKLLAYLNPKINTLSSSTIKKNVEALVTSRNGLSGCKEVNEDRVIVVKYTDADAELSDCCSVFN